MIDNGIMPLVSLLPPLIGSKVVAIPTLRGAARSSGRGDRFYQLGCGIFAMWRGFFLPAPRSAMCRGHTRAGGGGHEGDPLGSFPHPGLAERLELTLL